MSFLALRSCMKHASILALLCCLPVTLPAQAPDTSARRGGNVCWRGRPAPRCDWIVLTELGIEYPITSTRSSGVPPLGNGFVTDAFEERLTVAGGLLRTVGTRSAVGGLYTWGLGSLDRRTLEGRYRRWLDGQTTSVELSGGWLRTHLQPDNPHGTGATLALGLTFADLVEGHVRLDAVRARGETYNSVAVGGRLGQRGGVAGGILLAIGFAILLGIYSGFE